MQFTRDLYALFCCRSYNKMVREIIFTLYDIEEESAEGSFFIAMHINTWTLYSFLIRRDKAEQQNAIYGGRKL